MNVTRATGGHQDVVELLTAIVSSHWLCRLLHMGAAIQQPLYSYRSTPVLAPDMYTSFIVSVEDLTHCIHELLHSALCVDGYPNIRIQGVILLHTL